MELQNKRGKQNERQVALVSHTASWQGRKFTSHGSHPGQAQHVAHANSQWLRGGKARRGQLES